MKYEKKSIKNAAFLYLLLTGKASRNKTRDYGRWHEVLTVLYAHKCDVYRTADLLDLSPQRVYRILNLWNGLDLDPHGMPIL